MRNIVDTDDVISILIIIFLQESYYYVNIHNNDFQATVHNRKKYEKKSSLQAAFWSASLRCIFF